MSDYEREWTRTTSADRAASGTSGSAPGKHTRTAGLIQRQAAAHATGPDPGASFDLATSGAASAVPYQAEMERAFGASFSGVAAHLGGAEAQSGLVDLGAHAATHGSSIAFAEAAPSKALVAHELAHVVQQGGGGAVQCKAVDVSKPGDAAEQRADAAAAAVLAGAPVPDVGQAPSSAIHRVPVSTDAGVFSTTQYNAINNQIGWDGRPHKGAHIHLEFRAHDPVVADTIGLVQSVTTLSHTAAQPGGPATAPEFLPAPSNNQRLATPGGRAIDQGDPGGAGDTLPNTNPMYPVENTPGHVSTRLDDVAPNPAADGLGQHGHRHVAAGGAEDVVPAALDDTPLRHQDAGQYNQKFEVAAMVVDGAFANTFLGSVEWGWRTDASGQSQLDPTDIHLVRAGAPTAAFMQAAHRWNDATLQDPGGGPSQPTVDLPITTGDGSTRRIQAMDTRELVEHLADLRRRLPALSGADRAQAELEIRLVEQESARRPDESRIMTGILAATTGELLLRLPILRQELRTAAPAQLASKRFEEQQLLTELGRRDLEIEVRVNATQDTFGRDTVQITLTSGTVVALPSHDMASGDRYTFRKTVGDLLPLGGTDGNILVRIMELDTIGDDDFIYERFFRAPWQPVTETANRDGARYDIAIHFSR